jgi:hypothetical protein
MTKAKLEILCAFTMMSRRATDRLREEYFGGRTYGTEPEQLRADLDAIRAKHLPQSMTEKDQEFYETVMSLSEALFEQLMRSQQVLKDMYRGKSSLHLHSFCLDDACERAERVLRVILDLAMRGALGETKQHLYA